MLETWFPTMLRTDAGGMTTISKALRGLVSSAVTSSSLHPVTLVSCVPSGHGTTVPVPETIYTVFPHEHLKF